MSEPADGDCAIRAMRPDEIEAVRLLAGEIWRRHYPGIITHAQIEYMLAQRYAAQVLRAELDAASIWWDVASARGTLLGFSSYFLSDDGREMKLDKLYIHPDMHRRGLGGRMIGRVLEVARAQAVARVVLAVNKRNETAIAAYRKHGFEVAQSVVKGIGGGFVMDDFIMARAP